MKLPNIKLNFNVPIRKIRFSTAGDWTQKKDGSYEVWIWETPDPRYQAVVLIHELTELLWCHFNGITGKESDRFDAEWEGELKAGMHLPDEEAGFDSRAPYHKGHVWGARMEHLFCWIFDVRWRVYNDYWDEFFIKLDKQKL